MTEEAWEGKRKDKILQTIYDEIEACDWGGLRPESEMIVKLHFYSRLEMKQPAIFFKPKNQKTIF